LIVIIKNIQKMPGALEAELCRLRAAWSIKRLWPLLRGYFLLFRIGYFFILCWILVNNTVWD
jgi:hypothetical protein